MARDVFFTFSDITAASVSTAYPSSDWADFGAVDRNTAKFGANLHFTGGPSGGKTPVMVFQHDGVADIAVGSIFTLGIQESADQASFSSPRVVIAGPTVTVATSVIPKGSKFFLPLPLRHKRAIRPVVTTGGTWATSHGFKSWIEFGPNVAEGAAQY